MLLTALDPDLLIYKYEDWKTNGEHCIIRFDTLTLHRKMIQEYRQKLAMSESFAEIVTKLFPWREDCKSIRELQDLRQFFYDDLQRAKWIEVNPKEKIELQPSGIICRCVESKEVLDEWKYLLRGCINELEKNEFNPQIATWKTPDCREHFKPITIVIRNYEAEKGTIIHHLPIVLDEDSWYRQLYNLDWWPNLQILVDLESKTNPGIRNYKNIREQPVLFKYTDEFLNSVNRYCRRKKLRRSLINSLAKKVNGICDKGLGDEKCGERRRFRVTNYWRVHYREEYCQIVLEEFGPHSIGSVD